VAALIALCGYLSFYGLNAGEMYRNEGLRAIIAAEFLRSGNWIVPKVYGEALFTKPPGMYAAIALLSWPGGKVTDLSARLPSALAATASVFLMFWYVKRQLGFLGGLVTAMILPLSFMWLDKAAAAEIDMLQVAWVTAALVCFSRALEKEGSEVRGQGSGARGQGRKEPPSALTPRPSSPDLSLLTPVFGWWLAALLCVAGGVLTKWTAPVFFYGTVVPLLWWRGQLRLLWSRAHVVSAAMGAGVCLAWAGAAITLTGWDEFYGTVSREALVRFSPDHRHRPYPWAETLMHPWRIWAASLPVSLFALPALWPGFARLWDERGRRLLQVLHCWIWPNLLFWSVVPEHAARQSFPIFPAIAGLAGMVWTAWLTGRLAWRLPRLSPAWALALLLAGWGLVKLGFVYVVIPERNGVESPLLHRFLPDQERKREAPREKGELLARLVPAGQTLYLFRFKDEGIMFYYGRSARRLPGPAQLPSSTEPLYCILDEAEWEEQQQTRPSEVVARLHDAQGAPILLVKTER
jgi:4-amino-4-deoxy-L-arabinose transferase-like glycosyltransferase